MYRDLGFIRVYGRLTARAAGVPDALGARAARAAADAPPQYAYLDLPAQADRRLRARRPAAC